MTINFECKKRGRVMAIDYGEKRIGFAVSDPLQLIAVSLATISNDEVFIFLEEYLKKNKVELFLLGESRQLNYSYSKNMTRVEEFKKNLKKNIPCIKVRMVDERFTSVLARRAMIEGGLKKKKRRNKLLVDKLSAVILLQTYLDSIRR